MNLISLCAVPLFSMIFHERLVAQEHRKFTVKFVKDSCLICGGMPPLRHVSNFESPNVTKRAFYEMKIYGNHNQLV